MSIDHTRAEHAVRELLIALGQDPEREGLRDTPTRVAKAWAEMLSGDEGNAEDILKRTFDADGFDQIVALSDIPFYSTCEHHLLPFHGKAHVAYLPQKGGRVVGLSKMARLVQMHARRLQLQERMTTDIANDLQRHLDPLGVAVVVQAGHLCMQARGVQKPGSVMTTSVVLGVFREGSAKAEVLRMLLGGQQ
ncbi:MAG: GTP cyclohydrolase 1 [Actinobacteria bacterium ADurb.Bin444]|nr:MAG: GTP cyclohydrolase 1 [Actinobacteria bacterium ADurb.Bin444]